MIVGLMVHIKRRDAVEYASQAIAYLRQAGVMVIAEDDAAPLLGDDVPAFSQSSAVPDVVITLGGDGTLLRGAQYAMEWDSLLLGINLGRVGFLAEIDPDYLVPALDSVLAGEYATQTRPILQVSCGDDQWYAVNDVVVSRGGYSRLITINAMVDGESSGRYVADGLIVATPTGSTGYSLSAGGPVISPKVDCMVITPICAHTLQHRPSVVQGDADIRLELLPDEQQSASLQIDGQSRAVLRAGMSVHIRKDSRSLKLIHMKEGSFFQLVRDKLTEWTQ